MPRRCCVPGCQSNYDSTLKVAKAESTFLIPKDVERRKQWVTAIPRANWIPGPTAAVCAKHFHESDIIKSSICRQPGRTCYEELLRYPKLKEDAIPSIFPNLPHHLSSQEKTKRLHPDKRGATGAQVLQTLSLHSPKTTAQRAPHVLTIPIQLASPMKVSSLKGSEATLLPKMIHLASNSMVLSGSQRLAAQHVLPSNPPKNYISPILDHSGSRKHQEMENDFMPEYKRRETGKVGKGLRHFSMKVCEKVRKKGMSYNEVADELVAEFTNPSLMTSSTDQQYDQKNIRRRVYDALNVLMAMNIISKEKKEIQWLGLPTNSLQEYMNLEKDKQRRIERIKLKTQELHDLILQQISFKNLVERNRSVESKCGAPTVNSAIQLPFIIVNTSRKTVIDCSIATDKMEYLLNFNDKFEIHHDTEVLKRVGMVLGLDKGECSEADLHKAKGMVPKSLKCYVVQLATSQVDPLPPELGVGPSSSSLSAEELNANLGVGELSHQPSQTSLSNPLSPSLQDFSDEDLEVN